MLYRPSFLYPSVNGREGDGVIDATKENTFTAVIHGDSPVVAYRVGIFRNNATSTIVYQSEIQVLDEPFYGTDINGNQVLFEYTIPANPSYTPSGGTTRTMVNGYTYGYKYILTLWWNYDPANTEANCVSSFETVFTTRADPTLMVDPIPNGTIDNRTYLFSASYSQANNSGVTWFRWTLAEGDDHTKIIDQTKKIYTNAALQYQYDGFLTDTNYAVRCEVQTSDEVEIASDWLDFTVHYDTVYIQSALGIGVTPDDAIRIDFSKLGYLTGVADPDNGYRYWESKADSRRVLVQIDEGTSITFEGSAHFALELPIQGEFVTSFCLQGGVAPTGDSDSIVTLEGTDDNGKLIKMELSHRYTEFGLAPSEMLYPQIESNLEQDAQTGEWSVVNSDLVAPIPDSGNGGEFVLTVTVGDPEDPEEVVQHTIDTDFTILNWYVVMIKATGIDLYEMPFRLNSNEYIIG